MIAYLTKSDANEGFNQIINFLNGSSIKYALTINPNIYVSCIKQFWTSVAVKKVNDVIRLQALVDKKKVVITEASIRDAFRLDDAEGIECLPNEEIFAELARMGYEKPSTKLTFYKAFFLSQWKFLIHTILQCISAKRISWNEFSSSMASAIICLSSGRKFNFSKYIFDNLVRNVDSPTKFYMYPRFLQLMIRKQVGDLSSHSTKYTSPALTQKVFANMRRVGVPTAGIVAKGDVSSANDEVPTAVEEPSIPSPTPPTLLPQPSHDQPSTSQDAKISMDLLQNLMDTCTTLTRRVYHLEQDKVAQALEITKLKLRVKKLERRNKASKLKRLKKVSIAQRIDTSDDTVMDDVSKQGGIIENIDADEDVVLKDANDVAVVAKDGQDADIDEIDVVTTARIITKVVTAASITITAADVPIPAATTAAAPTLTAAPSKRTKGVVIRDPEESATPSTIIHFKAKSKEKCKGILRKQKEDKSVKRYQALKRKPQTEAQARKNMMNKEQMDEEDSRALKRLNESQEEKADKKQKLDEEVKELKRHLYIVTNDEDDVYTEASPLARKVPVVDYEIYNQNNKPYYKIKRADDNNIYNNTVDFASREEIPLTRSDITSKESSLQLVYDVLRLTPFYKAIMVTSDVLEIYMQEFWVTATVHHHLIRFKMDNKKHIVNLEYFREMLHICPRLPNQTFDELPFEEEILAQILWGMYHKKNVDFAYLLWEDFVYQVEHKEAKKSNEMYYSRDDKMFTMIKLVSRHQNTQQFGAMLPVELANEDIRDAAAYKEYFSIASEAAPPKTKASVRKTQSSSDTTMPPPTDARVLDVPTDESDEEISWKSSDEDDDDQDDDDQDDNDDDQDTNNEDDDFVHPKLSIYEEEAKDEESFDPIIQTPENSNDEGNDDASLGMNVGGEDGQDAEYDDEQLYRDVNINLKGRDVQMTDVHTTQEFKDTYVTLTPVNPYGRQQSSSVSSQFVTSMVNPSLDAGIDSLFETTPRFAGAVSSILEIVKRYIDQRMNEAVKIIKEQVKEHVKVQVSKILLKIKKTVNEQLEAEVLTRSSNSSKSSYAVAADLSEMELKKILIEKMESNKCRDDADKDEEASVGTDRGSKRRREGKESESTRSPKEKANKTTSKSNQGFKSHQKTVSESALAEVPMQTTQDLEEPSHQEFELGAADDQPIAEASQHPEWFQQQKKPPTLDRRRVIPFDHFINNDLEYLRGGASSRKKAEKYHGRRTLCFQCLSKNVHKKHRHPTACGRSSTRCRKLPKQLNLTKPNTYHSDLKRKEVYTAYSNSRGFIYQNKDKQNRLSGEEVTRKEQ
nr:hypothetical protein [Tanacetum cinerariifolium]